MVASAVLLLLSDDRAECWQKISIPEGCEAIDQLIHEDAKRPPVNSAVVALAIDDLRSQIFLCAHKGVGPCIRLCHQQVGAGV